jgi:hypothetical protein
MQEKIRFFGRIVSVQPRANVWRYRLDNRSHGMKGYNLFLKGVADSEDKDFSIAISEKQQEEAQRQREMEEERRRIRARRAQLEREQLERIRQEQQGMYREDHVYNTNTPNGAGRGENE